MNLRDQCGVCYEVVGGVMGGVGVNEYSISVHTY